MKEDLDNNANFILDYATRYPSGGIGKWLRLLHVAKVTARSHPNLSKDALEICLEELKTGSNSFLAHRVTRYYADLTGVSVPFDFEKVNGLFDQRLASLQQDMQLYLQTEISESIRLGYIDLGSFFLESGKFTDAAESFAKARELCLTTTQLGSVTLSLVQCHLFLAKHAEALSVAENYVEIHRSLKEGSNDSNFNNHWQSVLGLTYLTNGKFTDANEAFGLVTADFAQSPLTWISVEDLAFYTVVAGFLACKGHQKSLRANLIDRGSSKVLLESLPRIRLFVRAFLRSYYSTYQSAKGHIDYLLQMDKFLAPHREQMLSSLQYTILQIYMSPYASLPIDQVFKDFGVESEQQVEWKTVIATFCQDKHYRIDAYNEWIVKDEDDIVALEKLSHLYRKCDRAGLLTDPIRELAKDLQITQ